MLFRSNEDTAPCTPDGPARRPFTSNSVRFSPRPRNEMVAVPRPPFTTFTEEMTDVTCGEPAATVVDCSIVATSEMPLTFADSVSTTSIGAALVNVSLRIRDPVMTSSSTWPCSSAAGSVSWARALAAGCSTANTAAANGVKAGTGRRPDADRSELRMVVSLMLCFDPIAV